MGLEKSLRRHLEQLDEAQQQKREAERLEAESNQREVDQFTGFVSEVRKETDQAILPLLGIVNRVLADGGGEITVSSSIDRDSLRIKRGLVYEGKLPAVRYNMEWGITEVYGHDAEEGETIAVVVFKRRDYYVTRIYGGHSLWSGDKIDEIDLSSPDSQEKMEKAIAHVIETGHSHFYRDVDPPIRP